MKQKSQILLETNLSNIQNQGLEEAKIFGKYLIGMNINAAACDLYCQAIESRKLISDVKEKKIEIFIKRFPFWIACIDAVLAMTNKQSSFRKKLLVMLAVLESLPEYSSFFLPKKYSFFSFYKIFAVGVRSVLRFIIGYIIIHLI